jgi:hypothetical protein
LTTTLLVLIFFAILLLALLGVALRDPRRLAKPASRLASFGELDHRHVTYFPQVRQAMDPHDFLFLALRGSRRLGRRVRRERREIVFAYLQCLRNDFLKLWRLARVAASLSPQVGAAQEFARLRLGLTFSVRYEMVRIKLLCGFAPLPELGSLSEVVGRLSIRLESAMRDLGERAALGTKLASSLDGRDLNTP